MTSRSLQPIQSVRSKSHEDPDHVIENLTHRLSSLEKLTATLLLENTGLKEENKSLHPNNATTVSDLNPQLVVEMAAMIEKSMDDVMKSHDYQNDYMQTIFENNTNNLDKLIVAQNQFDQLGGYGSPAHQQQQQKKSQEDGSNEMVSLMSGDLISLRHDGKHRFPLIIS